MSTRDRLAEIPAGTEQLRQIRHLKPGDFADLTAAELTAGARWLRAASYSARLGAERFDAELNRRNQSHNTGETP